MKPKKTLIYLLLLGFGLLLSCGGERHYSVETKNGIRFVHNRQPASSEPAAHLEFVRKIGEMESEDENLLFVFPISVARDGDGNLFVLDSRDFCIKKFDRNGNFLMKFGRQGQGPGEFQYPMKLGIGGQLRQIDRLKSTVVSRGIGIDRLSRIWVLGFIKEVPEIKERDEFIPQDYNAFEIYDPYGVLLCHVPLPGEIKSFDNFFMFENSIYFIDPYGECCVFEYKIVEY